MTAPANLMPIVDLIDAQVEAMTVAGGEYSLADYPEWRERMDRAEDAVVACLIETEGAVVEQYLVGHYVTVAGIVSYADGRPIAAIRNWRALAQRRVDGLPDLNPDGTEPVPPSDVIDDVAALVEAEGP